MQMLPPAIVLVVTLLYFGLLSIFAPPQPADPRPIPAPGTEAPDLSGPWLEVWYVLTDSRERAFLGGVRPKQQIDGGSSSCHLRIVVDGGFIVDAHCETLLACSQSEPGEPRMCILEEIEYPAFVGIYCPCMVAP